MPCGGWGKLGSWHELLELILAAVVKRVLRLSEFPENNLRFSWKGNLRQIFLPPNHPFLVGSLNRATFVYSKKTRGQSATRAR